MQLQHKFWHKFKPSVLVFTYAFLASIFLIHYALVGQAVYGDGIGYYAYLHSWYFDFDINFSNEYRHLYSPQNNNLVTPVSVDQVQIVATNSEGGALNHFSPGMAVLLFPFYMLADIVGTVANLFGARLALNGYSDLYQIGVGLGAIGYVVAGLHFLDLFLKQLKFEKKVRWLTLGSLLFATNLIFYGAYDILNSHFAAFFLVSVFCWYFFVKLDHTKWRHYAVLGSLVGLMALTRPQDGVIAVVVMLDLFLRRKSLESKQLLKNSVVLLSLIVLFVAPLLWQWYLTFDSFDTHPYFMWLTGAERTMQGGDFVMTLFHIRNGLLSRTPVLLLAATYFLYLIFKKQVKYELKLLALFFIMEYLIIVFQGGWKAAAYGGRLYITTLPFFTVVLAHFFARIHHNWSYKKICLYILVFVAANAISITSFILFEKEASNFSRGTEIQTLNRVLQKLQ